MIALTILITAFITICAILDTTILGGIWTDYAAICTAETIIGLYAINRITDKLTPKPPCNKQPTMTCQQCKQIRPLTHLDCKLRN